ncbi:MAG TPA: DUF3052 family protein [Gemmatimonadota bacterium]|nr:DUF3052 family protein [Gemmatimonadota bacterium]
MRAGGGARWKAAPVTAGSGYSGTPLVRKLGLKPGMRVRLLDAPEGYWSLLGGSPGSLEVEVLAPDDPGEADFTHLFAVEPAALAEGFERARRTMAEDGMVWASWPKKSSDLPSEIGRAEVMAAGKTAGLVDVKVCAVDETWSGLRFVIPVAERGKPGAGRTSG